MLCDVSGGHFLQLGSCRGIRQGVHDPWEYVPLAVRPDLPAAPSLLVHIPVLDLCSSTPGSIFNSISASPPLSAVDRPSLHRYAALSCWLARRSSRMKLRPVAAQGEMIGKAKTAIEVHKYCVLVTDVPVEDALQQARKEVMARAAERDVSTRGAQHSTQQSTLTQSALSMHAEAANEEHHHEQWRMWDWITRQFFVRNHHHVDAGQKGELAATGAPPVPANGGNAARADALKSQDAVTPRVDRWSQDARWVKNGLLRSAPPAAVAEAACDEGPRDDAALLSGESESCGSGGWDAGDAAWPPPLRRTAGGTDLRQEHVRDRLGQSLLASQLDTANAVEGELALAAWRKVMAAATVPEALEREVCQWLENKRREDAARAEAAARDSAEVGPEAAGARRRRAAGAVAEGHERSASAHSNGVALAGPRRPSRAMSTHDGEVAFIEDDEATRCALVPKSWATMCLSVGGAAWRRQGALEAVLAALPRAHPDDHLHSEHSVCRSSQVGVPLVPLAVLT